MADEPVSKEEADRIAAAKSAMGGMYGSAPDVTPADATAAINASLNDPEPEPAPVAAPSPERALHDQFVQQYKTLPNTGAASTEKNLPYKPTAGDRFKDFLSADTGGDHQGMAVDAAVTGEPEKQALVETPPALKSEPQKVADADAEAAKRAEFKALDAQRAQGADARLSTPSARAVLVSPGGMRLASATEQVTQGPEVRESDRLLHEIEYNATRAAGDTATAELERDKSLAGLEAQHSKANAAFGKEERGAQQKESDALGQVSNRLKAALDASQKPVVAPAQELANMNMGQKLGFILASAGGGFAGRETGTNSFLDGYNQMVNARIDTQKREAEQGGAFAKGQENLYGIMKQGFQSDDAARGAVRLMYLQALDTKMKETALHYNINTANPRYMQMQSQIAKEILDQQEKLAQISGTKVTQEKVSKYVAPQVAVVGGGSAGLDPKKAKEYRGKIGEEWQKRGLGDAELDLDTVNNVMRSAESKSSFFRDYVAAHPGSSKANAFFSALSDPAARQRMVDVEQFVKESLDGKGMRSELGRQLAQTMSNPQNAPQAYNRFSHAYQKAAAEALASVGPANEVFPLFREMRREEQDIQDTTNSPVRAEGAEPLPNALPRQ